MSASSEQSYRWPNYLLPSIPFFPRRPSQSLVSAALPAVIPTPATSQTIQSTSEEEGGGDNDEADLSDASSYDSAKTSPLASDQDESTITTNNASIQQQARQLDYLHGSTSVLKCRKCQSDICFSETVISKGFNGRHGRAYLCNPIPPNTHTCAKPTTRQLATGTHLVADISCSVCLSALGWKYISASDPQQYYKVGKFILETKKVVRVTCWQAHDIAAVAAYTTSTSSSKKGIGAAPLAHPHPQTGVLPPQPSIYWDVNHDVGAREQSAAQTIGDVNSEDEDELEDMFLGKWTPSRAARRRRAWQKETERRDYERTQTSEDRNREDIRGGVGARVEGEDLMVSRLAVGGAAGLIGRGAGGGAVGR